MFEEIENTNRMEDGFESTEVFYSPLTEQMLEHGKMMSDSMNRSSRYQLSTPQRDDRVSPLKSHHQYSHQ